MAKAIAWTPFSAADLEEIHRYIEKDSATYAAKVAEQVLESIDRVADFPNMGRVVPEFDDQALQEIIV